MGLVVPTVILLAFWAARRRILEEPGQHLPLLRRVAVVGLGVGVGWSFGLVTTVDSHTPIANAERAGARGPAEVLLRRLVYPRSGTRASSTA